MYQRCTRCVMDNSSDPYIVFDQEGKCNYCNNAIKQIKTTTYFPDKEGEKKLDTLLKRIQQEGRNKKYDAIMGISGGLDSSYLTYLGYKWGLRILLVHIDDGFDTDISKRNLKKLIRRTNFDYKIIKPDEKQYCALTKAYMKAGVPDIAIPQDNILFAYIYNYMRYNKIKFFLSGGNFALESILQKGNTFTAYDIKNIKDIHKKCGTEPINKLEFISSYKKIFYHKILGIESPRPLNYIDYNRNKAFKELKDFCDFEYYGRKHLENILTMFIQLYWFPKKFNVDKRTSHLSSMIVSGQMTRKEALKELEEPLYSEIEMENCISIIKKKLNISDLEFEKIMNASTHQHREYKIQLDTWIRKL